MTIDRQNIIFARKSLNPIIQTSDIKKIYHKGSVEVPALQGVTFGMVQGEFLSLVGRSGSGKSTLLHILGTLDKPDSGTVIINQTDVSSIKEEKLAQLRSREIGFIFQFHHLLPEFTAFENVLIPAQILGNPDDKIKRAEELFDYIGLKERKEHYPSQLSGGERLRVAVLRALINNPSIIFADEPTGNLDAENAKKLLQLFKNINNDFEQSFVITTHNQEVAALGDRKFILDNGVLNSRG